VIPLLHAAAACSLCIHAHPHHTTCHTAGTTAAPTLTACWMSLCMLIANQEQGMELTMALHQAAKRKVPVHFMDDEDLFDNTQV
jgi:hypothetical protein